MVGVYTVAGALIISILISFLFKNRDSFFTLFSCIFYGVLSMPFLKVYFTNSVDEVMHSFIPDAPRSGLVFSKEIDSLLLNGYPIFFLLTIIILLIKRVFDENKARNKELSE